MEYEFDGIEKHESGYIVAFGRKCDVIKSERRTNVARVCVFRGRDVRFDWDMCDLTSFTVVA